MNPTSTRPEPDPDSLEASWQDLRVPDSERRPKAITRRWKPPSQTAVQGWLDQLDSGAKMLLAVEGPTWTHRHEVYSWIFERRGVHGFEVTRSTPRWLTEGVHRNFSLRVGGCHQRRWGLLWELLDVEEFTVDGPLYSLVDDGSNVTKLFKAIWEARFALKEGFESRERVTKGLNVQHLFNALPAWMSGAQLTGDDRRVLAQVHIHEDLSKLEQLDTLFFLLALARQHGVFGRAVFVFDSVDRALNDEVLLDELYTLTRRAEYWGRHGSYTGVVFGYSADRDFMRRLKAAHPFLAKALDAARV